MSEIDEFLQKALAGKSERDADHTLQTPVYSLLAAGRIEEAEAVARQTVSDLEVKNSAPALQSNNVASTRKHAVLDEQNSEEHNIQLGLLADALIAQGIALARLKKLEAAQAILERAITVAGAISAPDKAALAALTMIEELDELPCKTLLSLYARASARMAETRDSELQRLIEVARKIMTRFRGKIDPGRALDILLAPPSLHEELMRFEERLIEHVQAQTNRSLTDSASSFPLIQERLTCTIELRPKPSLKKRNTDRSRSRKE